MGPHLKIHLVQAALACPAQAFIQQPTTNALPTVVAGDHHAQRAHVMVHPEAQAAHNDAFPGSDQHAAATLFDRGEGAGLALGDIEAGFGADAVTFLRDRGDQGDDIWHISRASWTNKDACKHGRQYDVYARSRLVIAVPPRA
jgi:hypothetical protein